MASKSAQIELDRMGITPELTSDMFAKLFAKKSQRNLNAREYIEELWEVIFWLRIKEREK